MLFCWIYVFKSGSFHLWPNVRMIAIWPSSEKLELGFRWDLPACCAWGSFAASLTQRPVLRLVSCLTLILMLVDEKNILIQNSLQSYSFATHDNQCRAVSTWWELCIQIRAVTWRMEILLNIITNNLLFLQHCREGTGVIFRQDQILCKWRALGFLFLIICW